MARRIWAGAVLLAGLGFTGCPSSDHPTTNGPVLNEFQARNDSTLQDEFGDYDDWIEVFNSGPDTVDLSGYTLTDHLEIPDKYVFPDSTLLPPGAFLLIWADGEPEEGPLHASFRLRADGEELGLFTPDLTPLDQHVFRAQGTDMSEGRYPDGEDNWIAFGACDSCRTAECSSNCRDYLHPTPGAPNRGGP